MATALPLSVILLLVWLTATSAQVDYSNVAQALTDACFDGAGRSVRSGHQEIVQEINGGLSRVLQDIRSERQEAAQEIQDGVVQTLQDVCLNPQQGTLQTISDELNGSVQTAISRGQQEAAQQTRSELQSINARMTVLQKQLSGLKGQLTALHSTQQGCPSGWSRHRDNCYLIPLFKANGLQAHHKCASLDRRARLASVHRDSSRHINRMVASSGVNGVWVGLIRMDGNRWEWSDGTPFDYTSWAKNQPDNARGREDCVWLRKSKEWNDYDCVAHDSSDRFMCQITLQ